MKVAFIHDDPGYVGGAELTMNEFLGAAPKGVHTIKGLGDEDTVVLGNIVHQTPDLIPKLKGRKVVWYHNDLSPWINQELQDWLDLHADEHIFCSPLQMECYGLDGHLIPPALNLPRYWPPKDWPRDGTVSIGAWRHPSKGQQSLLEYAQEHGPVDVYGGGDFAPMSPPLNYLGEIDVGKVPETLWKYEKFIHLPWAVEPFGRCVVEAWAAGCELVVNRLVGARYWIDENPEGLSTAASDFWSVVLGE